MRPVAQKPQEQIVIYSDAPTDYAINIRAKSTTDYIKVTWWDGTVDIENSNILSRGQSTLARAFASKKSDTNANKKIILTSCDSTGKYTGNITWFNCSKNKKTSYYGHGRKTNNSDPPVYGGPRNQSINKLDVSTCSHLAVCICDHNTLTSLGDISACRNLNTLACTGNSFASIDVSRCKNLEKLFCNHNPNLSFVSFPSNLKRIGASSTSAYLSLPDNSQLADVIIRDNGSDTINLSGLHELINANIQPESYSRTKNTNIKERILSEVYISDAYKLSSLRIGTNQYSTLMTPYLSYVQSSYTGVTGSIIPPLNMYQDNMFDLSYGNLQDSLINDFFTGLNSTTNGTQIWLVGNPGTETCNQFIATSKGYSVYI